MKAWRLISGILSMVLFVIITFQSCAAGVVDSLEENGESSGSVGFVCGLLILVGGIVSVVVKNSTKKGAAIAIIVIYGLAAIMGFAGHGGYSDLVIWSVWALIVALIALISLFIKKKPQSEE